MKNRNRLQAALLAVCCATLAIGLSACGPTAQSADSANLDLPPLALDPLLDTRPALLANQRVQEQLDKTIPEIRFHQITFEEALNFLRDAQKVNISPHWAAMEAAGITKTTEIFLQLRDVTFGTALRELLTKASGRSGILDYTVHDGIIKVSTGEDLGYPKNIVIYDVRDLLARQERQLKADAVDMFTQAVVIRQTFGRRQVVEKKPGSASPIFGPSEEEALVDPENALEVKNYHAGAVAWLMDLLRTSVLPDSWAPTGDANMKELAGISVVKQTYVGHRELAKLLEQIRESFAAAEQVAPAGPTIPRPSPGAVPWYRHRSPEPRPPATTGFGTHGTSPDID